MNINADTIAKLWLDRLHPGENVHVYCENPLDKDGLVVCVAVMVEDVVWAACHTYSTWELLNVGEQWWATEFTDKLEELRGLAIEELEDALHGSGA